MNFPPNRPLNGVLEGAEARDLAWCLAGGGDARITLRSEDGLNQYMSAPYPRDVVAYSSSTISDISIDAFAYLLDRWHEGFGLDYASSLDALRAAISQAFALPKDISIAFAPSGTDLEYTALALVRGRAEGGVHNVLLGADEIGSGCIHSAHGRYFARETAIGAPTQPAKPVAGMGPVSLVDIPVRCSEGIARPSTAIVEEMAREIELAIGQDRHALVHCVHGSKTGLILPSLADLDALSARFGDRVTFVVDACQARITSQAIADYLERGAIVLMTGSKFAGAAPFSGWALIPTQFRLCSAPLPSGYGSVFRRAEWPASWPGAEILSDSPNRSLALRLAAALFEIERFQAIGMERVEELIAVFEASLDKYINGQHCISRVLPGCAKGNERPAQHPIEMRTLATLDVSDLPGFATFEQAQQAHRAMAEAGLRLGQPVKCVRTEHLGERCWGGTLRVGLSMPQLTRWAPMPRSEVRGELDRDMSHIADAVQHIAANV